MAKLRLRPPRWRTDPALALRKWAIDYEPDEIARALVERVTTVDNVIAPNLAALRPLHQLLSASIGVALTPEFETWYGRRNAFTVIAGYYLDHPYRKRHFLPRIVVGGVPWEDLPPDSIHVLDLTREQLVEAWHGSGVAKELSRPAQGSALSQPLPTIGALPQPFHVQVAIGTIRLEGPWAWLSPVVWGVAHHLAWHVEYGSTREQRREAAAALHAVLYALSPVLTRPFAPGVEKTAARFKEIHQRVVPLWEKIKAQGPTPELLAQAHALDKRITRPRLAQWPRRRTHTIARELTAKQLRCSPRTVRGHLDDDFIAGRIHEVWTDFAKWFASAPPDHPLRTLLLPPSSLPPVQPS